MKISSKLTIVLLLISILPLFGFAFFAITKVTDRVREDHIQLLENIAFNNADKIDRFLQQRYWEIRSWVTLDIPKVALEFDTHERLNQLLNHLVQTYGDYSLLMILDTHGKLFEVNTVCSVGNEIDVSSLWELRVKDELWYNRNLWGQVIVGDPEALNWARDIRTNGDTCANESYTVRLSAPIAEEGGSVAGVWVSILNWDSIHRILALAQSELRERGFGSASVFLLSKDGGTLIDFPDRSVIGSPAADYNLAGISAMPFNKTTGYLQYEWNGSQRSVGFSRIKDKLSWICAVSIDNSEIFAPIAKLNRGFTYLVLSISAIIFAAAYYMSRRISQPIISISQSTKAIAKGNFEHTLTLKSKDEIGELAVSFNDMARSLKEYQTRLQNYNRTLETEVEERTWELRRSEEKFRSLFEQAPVGIAIQLENRQIVSVNGAFCRMFGYDAQEAEKLSIFDLCSTSDHGKLRMSGRGESEEIELYMKRKDGSAFPVILSTRGLEYEGEKALETVIQDLTEKKRIEEQLVQSERLRALGEMASGVAHDFNNVLAAIVGNAQLMILSTDDPSVVRDLQVIERAAKDGAEIVKRIQEFSRVRKDVAHVGVDMCEIVRDAIAITSPRWKDQLQGKGITIDVKAELKAEHSTIAGNAAELREVLTNLIFNAVDAMPGGGQIVIQTRNEADCIVIAVTDTGTGMPDHVKRKVFEPFFSTKDVGNSGLGLSVSYGIIARHDGEISVESEPGKGTTFTIKLPLALQAEPEKRNVETTKKRIKKARILVIDDEDEVRQVIFVILSKNGHEVQTAINGTEGLRIFKHDPFDIVITDLGMPEMSGYDVAGEIKLIDPKVPVLMITGWGTQLDKEKLEQNGIDLVIPKPFDVNILINRISEAMEIRNVM